MDSSTRHLEFVGLLGQGGFGAVYLANLKGRGGFARQVAVKVLNDGLESQPQLLARQRDEARLLGKLAHEQIVQVLELTEVNGRPAVVMEYVEGVDVAELQLQLPDHRVPARPALEIVAAAASALDAAWNSPDPATGAPLHVIHRDIKPANLLITPNGGVKVLDFGIARGDFDREGKTGTVSFGTPRFMAPEQWLDEAYGSPVDIYALGVTLFELVAGKPWERPGMSHAVFATQAGRQISGLDGVSPDIKSLILDMIAHEASARPAAAEVQLRALELAEQLRGESLVVFARAHVPALVKARRARLRSESVPPASVRLDPDAPDTLARQRRAQEPVARRSRVPRILAGMAGVAVVSAVTLGGAWELRTKLGSDAPNAANGSVEAGAVTGKAGDATATRPVATPDGTATDGTANPDGSPMDGPGTPETTTTGTSPPSDASDPAGPVATSKDGGPVPPVPTPVSHPPSGIASPPHGGNGSPATTRVSPTSATPATPTSGTTGDSPTGRSGTGGSGTSDSPTIGSTSDASSSRSGSGTPAEPDPPGDSRPPVVADATPAATSPASPKPVHAAPLLFNVVSTPMGAAVFVDGTPRGRTPCNVPVTTGAHVIAVVAGDDVERQTVTVSDLGPRGILYDFHSHAWSTIQ